MRTLISYFIRGVVAVILAWGILILAHGCWTESIAPKPEPIYTNHQPQE